MKAALLTHFGAAPIYTDVADPIPQNDDEILMTVKAASVKNLDKLRASGTHYASYKQLPAIVGIDAAGILPDGTRVYAQGIGGTIAEKVCISKHRYTVLPDAIDFNTAAALPNAVLGAALALKFRSNMQPGQTLLINGATGVTGQIAVQIARHYGAGKIIITGRNPESLEKLLTLGADISISLLQDDDAIVQQLKEIHAATPIDIVLDYLWAHPMSLIIKAVKGGGIHSFPHPVRVVTVGSMAGEDLTVQSATLRGTPIELVGSGLGSLSPKEMQLFGTEILPEMFALAASGKLTMRIHTEPLSTIETAWNMTMKAGERLVICVGE
ncbi:MAG: zinc-binding alcohol dehydrogenase family protein [Ignavibacteria bacterium]|nr:zinc-binding alcohol dehydrogenase family protein [Ignavibacteria bacterium]